MNDFIILTLLIGKITRLTPLKGPYREINGDGPWYVKPNIVY